MGFLFGGPLAKLAHDPGDRHTHYAFATPGTSWRHPLKTSILEDPFATMEIPPALQDSLERHRENLARLIVSLRSVGLSEQQVEASVSVMVESYKQELLRAVKAMVR